MKNLKESQILTSNYPYGRYSLDYALDSLQRMEAGPIEFYACYPHFHLDDVDYWDVKRITRKLIEHKLNIVCFTPEQCLYPVNIAALDPAARKRSMDVFKKSIQFGAEMGTVKFHCHSSSFYCLILQTIPFLVRGFKAILKKQSAVRSHF